jgi:hypothetical protein
VNELNKDIRESWWRYLRNSIDSCWEDNTCTFAEYEKDYIFLFGGWYDTINQDHVLGTETD